jgi:hypothetical protein
MNMDKVIPRVQFDIDENNPSMGVKVISLVDDPAIESNFVFFNKEKAKKKFIELKGEKFKQIVAGLALIPDKDILRIDASGEPYVGVFSTEVVEKVRTKFHKELLTDRVNTDHSSNSYVDAYLIESFIIDSDERLADVKAKGIEEATIGSWFVAYKIEDAEVFKKVVSGELNGFSVEIFLQELYTKQNNSKENVFEKVMNKFLEKFKQLLSEMEAGENKTDESKKLAQGKTSDGKTVEYGEVGEAVNIDGSAAPDGEYSLDNGKIVVVASGVATEIKDAEQAPAEQKKEEKMGSSVFANYQLKDGRNASVNVSNINEVSFYDGQKSELAATGEYELKDGGFLVVQDGKFVQVKDTPESKAFTEKEEQLKKALAEIETLKVELESLKKKPLTNPVSKTEIKIEKKDVSKMSVLEKLAAKNGIEISEKAIERFNKRFKK